MAVATDFTVIYEVCWGQSTSKGTGGGAGTISSWDNACRGSVLPTDNNNNWGNVTGSRNSTL